MKTMGALFIAAAFFGALFSSLAWAGTEFEDEQVVHYHLHKFSRGVVNIVTSPLEVPKQMIRRAKEQGTAAGQVAGYVTGTVTGVGWAVWRCTSGVVDICTAPLCSNTEGLIKPEFISDPEPVEE